MGDLVTPCTKFLLFDCSLLFIYVDVYVDVFLYRSSMSSLYVTSFQKITNQNPVHIPFLIHIRRAILMEYDKESTLM